METKRLISGWEDRGGDLRVNSTSLKREDVHSRSPQEKEGTGCGKLVVEQGQQRKESWRRSKLQKSRT